MKWQLKQRETTNEVGGEVYYVEDVGGANAQGIRVRRVEDGNMYKDVDGSIDA